MACLCLGPPGHHRPGASSTVSRPTAADLAAVFGCRGPTARCWCQRYQLARGEAFGSYPPPEERADRLRDQTDAGHPRTDTTSGLVAYADGMPVGWCAVEPRAAYSGLVGNASMVAWAGRDEDGADPGVWAVTCVLVRAGHRRRGVSRALVRATAEHARIAGARVLEGLPDDHRLSSQRGTASRIAEHLLGRGVCRDTPAVGSAGRRGDRALIAFAARSGFVSPSRIVVRYVAVLRSAPGASASVAHNRARPVRGSAIGHGCQSSFSYRVSPSHVAARSSRPLGKSFAFAANFPVIT